MAMEFLRNNHFASGGVVLGIGAMLYRHGGTIVSKIRGFVSRRLFVTVKIDRWTYGFEWIRAWIKEQLEKEKKLIYEYEIEAEIQGNDSTITLRQSDGRWFLTPRGFRIFVQMDRVEEKTDTGTRIYSKMSLMTARWNRKKLEHLMSVVGAQYGKKPAGKIYIPNQDGADWEVWCNVPETNLEHIVLPADLKRSLLEDLDTFINSEERYRNLGLSYKRGYLLFGPPGNGKTSLIRALAHHLNKSIAFVKAADLARQKVQNLISKTGGDKIIVVEDIDRASVVNAVPEPHALARATTEEVELIAWRQDSLQTILNLLDGVQGGNGQIIIMTANHPERLDAAFLRPGRIDRKFGLDNANRIQIEELFVKFYGSDKREVAKIFSALLPSGKISMARLQQHFIAYIDNHTDAITNAKRLLISDTELTQWSESYSNSI